MAWPTHDQLVWKGRKHAYIYQEPKQYGWIGWDTETAQGDIGVICRNVQPEEGMLPEVKQVYDQRYGSDLQDWIEWKPYESVDTNTILQQMFHPGFHGVWWNLRYDIECIIKQLPENLVKALLIGQKIKYEGFTLHYLPGKKFTLSKVMNGSKLSSHHFDFADFYHSSLNDAAKRFLNDSKKKETFTRQELGDSWEIWEEKKEEIITYCMYDAELTRKLAQLWVEWAEGFGIDANYPISPANVGGRHALKTGFPQYPERLHNTVGKAAWQAYYGGRFESRKKGWFDELWGIDLKSAYPAVMVDLPSSACSWRRTDNEKQALEHPWGFVECRLKIDEEAEWSPVMHRAGDGLVYGPVGSLPRKWITLDEYKVCKDDPNTRTDFIKAWVAEDNGERPLAWIGDLYEERAELKANDDPRQIVLKLIMNSVYGKTLQRNPLHEMEKIEDVTRGLPTSGKVLMVDGEPYHFSQDRYKIGPIFNPIYAATITARTRCRLWEMMEKYETAIVMTDGILIEEKPDPSDLGSELGEWEIDAHGEGVIIGNGLYQVGEKRSKRRGFNVPHRFKGWIDSLQNCDPEATSIKINQRRPLHPGEVMVRNDHDLTDVGAFVDMEKRVRFNHDRKRDFPDVTARDLLSRNVTGRCIKV